MSELFEAYSGSFAGDENAQDSGGETTPRGDRSLPGVQNSADDPEQNAPSYPEAPADKHSCASSSGYPDWLPPLECVDALFSFTVLSSIWLR